MIFIDDCVTHSPLGIRLMDDVVNMLILKKHNFLNFLPPVVSSELGEELVQFIVTSEDK